MKITSIQTSNFLGARAVDVRLDKPVSLFAGANGAGKSSIRDALALAFTADLGRISLKKDAANLISEGGDSSFVEVVTDADTYGVAISGAGKITDTMAGKGTPTALPYVIDAQRFASLDDKERRAFLFGMIGIKLDGASVTQRLLAKGLDAKKVEQIAPFLRAGFDAAQKEAAARAREAKFGWKTTTGGETYGSVKAASYRAAKPEVDAGKLEQAKTDLVTIENEIEAETGRLGDLQGRARNATEQAGKLAELRKWAGWLDRIRTKLLNDENDLKHWEEKVATSREKAEGGHQEAHHKCPECGALLQLKNNRLMTYVPPEKQADASAAAMLPEYEKALSLMRNCVANGKRDLADAEAAAGALRKLEEAGLDEAPSDEEIAALKARIDAMKHSRTNQQFAIRMLEDAVRQADEADEKTRRAAALHQDVQQWEAIADALAPDGIPGEMLAEALGPINERLARSANEAQWTRINIGADMRIFAAEEGAQPRGYDLLSESEKWRADAMIAEAVSHLSGVKLLVLDRFDILDLRGREDLLYWLDGMAAAGEIDTALIFGTLKALPAQLPATVAGFWIENGVAGILKDAA